MKNTELKIFQIGTIAFETKDTIRELKAIGGIPGYIFELVKYTMSKKIKTGLIGKIYNFKETKNLKYFEIQDKVVSTNKTLINLFLKSFTIKIPKKSIIHAHRPDNLAAFSFTKRNPCVLSLHGQQAKTVNDRKGFIVRTIYNNLEKIAFKKAKAIIAVDEITKVFYLSRFPQYKNKIIVIPTGVNTTEFKRINKKEIRRRMGYTSKEKIIIYVGRIEPPKKVSDIIKAFQILVKQDKSYKLVLVGDGVELKEMKKLAEKLNISQYIDFLGIRKRNELPELFNMADCSVLYSKNEGSPLAVKESLACGIPVVANKVGDVSVIIQDAFNGYIVKEESLEELAEKIKLAVDNSSEMRENCIISIKPYTIEKTNGQIIDLYKSILNEE